MTKEFKFLEYAFSVKALKAEIQQFDHQFHYLTHIASYKMERSGVIGKEEIRETVFFIIFGQSQIREQEEFIAKRNAFLTQINGKVLVIADLPQFKTDIRLIFNAHVPMEDKTKTPEQHEAELIERNKRHAEIETKQKKEQEAKNIIKEGLKKKYSNLLQTGDGKTSSRILATKNIRTELSKVYPGLKFSITSESYSGGDHIDIRWEDGATDKEVNEIVKKYQEGHFDGMTDCYNYSGNPFNDVFGGTKYLFTHRTINRERYIEVAEELGYQIMFEENRGRILVVDKTGGIPEERYSESIEREIRLETQDKSFYDKNAVVYPETEEKLVISSESGIEVIENKEKDGIEIRFPDKPSAEVLSKLKMNGFRWNNRTKLWYKKRSENALIFANSLSRGYGATRNTDNGTSEEGLITEEASNFERELETEPQQDSIR